MSSPSSVTGSSGATSRKTSQTSIDSLKSFNRKVASSRWRPVYHVMAPRGWMNDPCAPTYDPKTGLYHVFYQWNPNGPDWGDICWGWAYSQDLLSWNLARETALAIDRPYDHKGVFTGCMMPTTDGTLVTAYTSVSQLPIHHTLPHPKGSESLSVAKSVDGGKTWTKLDANPILPSEPHHLDVTGWRDPFVSQWPRMCDVLGRNHDTTLFGIISGGIRDVTPTTFLYVIDRSDLTRWEYVGPLVDFGLNMRPSRWSGDLGRNWEVTNFTTLRDVDEPSYERDFIVMGTEGCLLFEEDASPSGPSSGPSRPIRGQLWMSGPIQNGNETPVAMGYGFGGHLDHGAFYAANSFFDPKTQKQIVWGWITEDDLCDDLRAKQGWSGLLSLPRELSIRTMRHVVGASRSELSTITSFDIEVDPLASHTIRTLSSQPVDSVVEGLRQGARVRRAHLARPFGESMSLDLAFSHDDIRTQQWELDCSLQVSRLCSKIGMVLEHSRGMATILLTHECWLTRIDSSLRTVLTFDVEKETFTVDRPAFACSDSHMLINSRREKAPHTLFTQQEPMATGLLYEPLRVQIWRDQSVLEVFVNNRTAISTRIYAAEETFGIRFFSQDDLSPYSALETHGAPGMSQLLHATLYDGIGGHAHIKVDP